MNLVEKYRPHVIPERAEEISPGVFRWFNEGSVVVLPMFCSDPTKASEEWLSHQREGSTVDGFEREVLISFESWSGKRVYPEWNDPIHLSPVPLGYDPSRIIIVGIDLPGPPAAVWGQLRPVLRGRQVVTYKLEVLAELFMDGSIEEFGNAILGMNVTKFPNAKRFKYVSDPQAFHSLTGTKFTAASILKDTCGIHMIPGPINIVDRTEPVKRWLQRLVPTYKANDKPGAFQLDPECSLVRDGFRGGYCYLPLANRDRYREVPDKNEFSHIMNALEYLAWAAKPEEEKAKDTMPVLRFKPENVVGAYT